MSSVRIIAGRLGGRRLRAPRGQATRPTADRVREALFNILLSGGEPPPSQVLDLYAGTGALGLEALSRGVERATLVEEHAPTASLIRENAAALGLEASVSVVAAKVHDWLRRATVEHGFGWVFLDPPYAQAGELEGSLRMLAGSALLSPGALVVAEHEARDQPMAPDPLERVDQRSYGQTALTFWRKR